MRIRYQLIVLGQQRLLHVSGLVAQVAARFNDVGLNFSNHGELLEGANRTPEWEGFPVAVWFGGSATPDQSEIELVKEFLVRGFSVFPVVTSLTNFSAEVPECLHPINGQEFDPIRLASDVMTGFRLAKRFRQVFISYRRDESSGVANQLFHELIERGYKVFLDTVSVDAGADFQKALWSRMADVDLLVLLDSPRALNSRWVHQELNRAHDLGMAVVQLIWPGHKRTPGTELSCPISLSLTDFVGAATTRIDELSSSALENAVNVIESERIRSLNARRTRIVDGLLSIGNSYGMTFLAHPARHVDVIQGTTKIAEVLPFVGVPDSLSVFEQEQSKSHPNTFVVYNGLGVDELWANHLEWLNNKASIKVFQIDDLGRHI